IVITTPKAGVAPEEVRAVLGELSRVTREVESCTALAIAWGPMVEKKDAFVAVLGWESVQAHYDEVKAGPFADAVKDLLAKSDIVLSHAKLTAASK
ncbi:hypothetical protein EW146_g8965, partial [Bondarzewia mesenterica]